MAYNSDRKGYETKDGGLIRINGDDRVRIDIYDGNEREKGNHDRTTINYDTTTGTGRIDYHNDDKSVTSSTDVGCFLTTACMKQMQENFDDNCYFLDILRWFRDKFVSIEDKNHYYEVAPIIVSAIDSISEKDTIYQYIYENIVTYCVIAIENEEFDKAYERYRNSVLSLEEQFAKPVLNSRLVKTLKMKTNK